MTVTPYEIARRFLGLREVPGTVSNPAILAMLQLDTTWPQDDAVPWCAAFVNAVAFLLGLPRPHSLAARAWLSVGTPIELADARVGTDVVVLARGAGGHVGFYAGRDGSTGDVLVLGGNQGDAVSIAAFPMGRVLGVRRLDLVH